LVTAIWGSTFVIVKGALADASPLPFLAVRFTLAGLLLFVVLGRGRIDFAAVRPAVILGVFLFGGYFFQTYGLKYTSPTKSAFITGYSVILVPLILLLVGYGAGAASILGALLGLSGLYFLVLPSGLDAVNRGDILTLLGAVSFAIHIVLVGAYTRRFSFLHLVPVQILVVGLLAVGALAWDPGSMLHLTTRLVLAWIITAVFATGLAFTVQNWAQQYTPPAHTALIFTFEPVFAALTSWLVLHEGLGRKALLGSGLILGGMVISEISGRTRPSPVEG
jgi:drug/metabolite transporter (DMT)-like permease